MQKYREKNLTRIAALKKEWKAFNSEHVKAKDAKYAKENPERRAAARDKWRVANPEKDFLVKAIWARENAELCRNSRKQWELSNPGKKQAILAKRRAAKLQRTPAWLTPDDFWLMGQAYELAALRTKMLGFLWHVDHVIPLQGKVVSGLHVPTNLRVIPGTDNLKKHNSYSVL
jgi:hypothetical protein